MSRALVIVLQVRCDGPEENVAAKTSTQTSTTSISTTTSPTSTTTTPASTTTTPVSTATSTTTTTIIPTTPNPDEPPTFVDGANTCLILQAYLSLYVPYKNGTSDSVKKFTLTQPGINVRGKCSNATDSLILSWFPDESTKPFNLSLTFAKKPSSASNKDASILRDVRFEFYKSADVFPGSNETGFVNVSVSGSFFETPTDVGYTCAPQQNMTLGPDVVVGFSSVHFEAFRNSNTTDFSNKTMDCSATPSSNNAIPVAIGVTATILIALAVVAFVVGNRRRGQDYQRL